MACDWFWWCPKRMDNIPIMKTTFCWSQAWKVIVISISIFFLHHTYHYLTHFTHTYILLHVPNRTKSCVEWDEEKNGRTRFLSIIHSSAQTLFALPFFCWRSNRERQCDLYSFHVWIPFAFRSHMFILCYSTTVTGPHSHFFLLV